jgi:glycerol-3-phosphate O-acyltransferase
VLEDRSLLRELTAQDTGQRPSRLTQLREVANYVGWNAGRLLTRRWKRYGRAAVVIGPPMPLAPWYESHPTLFSLEKHERLGDVQTLADAVMARIGALIPVTPVPLVCAAIQTLDADILRRDALVARIRDVQDELLTLGAQVVRAERSADDTLDVALRMLVMRRVVLPQGDEFVVLPRGRELVSYYANSVAHLLGPYEAAVRTRDALPADALLV